MRYLLILLFALSLEASDTLQNDLRSEIIKVENARLQAIQSLNKFLQTVEAHPQQQTLSDAAKIIETNAIAVIAKETSRVEITKAEAMAAISKALDELESSTPSKTLEDDVLKRIAKAISSVELAKASATKQIVESAHSAELGKHTPLQQLAYPKQALIIAKNASAVQIAQAVANAEVAKAVATIEIARSSMRLKPHTATPEELKNLEKTEADATANISSYLAHIEVTKANMLAKIAKEVARVEVAKAAAGISEKRNINTYPTKLIRAD